MGRARQVAASDWRGRAATLALLIVFGLLFIEPMWLVRADFGSDDASYFSHAATLALDLDLDYSNEPVVVWSAGRKIAIGSPGAGWLAAPFVALFSLVDRVSGHPVIEDHGSYIYSWSLFGFFFAAVFYFVLGVRLYQRGIEAVWPGLDPRLNFLLALGTGVPFYVLRRFSMTHAFEFATCALAFWGATKLYRAVALGQSTRPWIAWSAVAAVANLAVRVNNLNTLVLAHTIVLLLFVFGAPGLPRPEWASVRRTLLRVTGAIAVAFAPLGVFNLVFYGAVYPTPSTMYGTPLTGTATRGPLEILVHGLGLVPNLIPLIFSSEFGILYTNPVLVLGGVFLIATLAWRPVRRPDLPHALTLLAVLAFFGLSTAIVLWWQSTGSSYGYRYLFPLYPVALAGLLIAASGTASRDRPGHGWTTRIRRWLLPAALVLSTVSVVSQTFFSASPALEVRRQVNVFGNEHSGSARGYLTRLPGELIDPDTWVSLAARRLSGFYVAPYVAEGSIRGRLPDEWIESYDRLYRQAPGSVYLQLTLILVLWVGAGWWLVRPEAAGRTVVPLADRRPAGPAGPADHPVSPVDPEGPADVAGPDHPVSTSGANP